MAILSHAETAYLRRHLDVVRHITLDPGGPGVVRLHLVPRRSFLHDTPFLVIVNGQDILPLSVSWAILLANFMDALQPFEGKEVEENQWDRLMDQAVAATRRVYRSTDAGQIRVELSLLLDTFRAVARGEKPQLPLMQLSLGEYAPRMVAPHRMDLMVSSMKKDGSWHCNQKCLHCYAAHQPLAETAELDTDQWLAIIQKCRAAGIPQLTFTGGEPTMRNDLVQLVRAAQWFVTRLNTNGRLLTPPLCKELYDASLDAVQVTLYSADAETHNALVGAAGFEDTVAGVKNALAAGLNLSVNTPLCSVNQDYRATLEFAHGLGVRYATCSGLIPTGGALTGQSAATRLSAKELENALAPAMAFAAKAGMEVDFTSPGWLSDETLQGLGLTRVPSCGACLSNMAIAPDGTVLPCQSWLTGPGLGNALTVPWQKIWQRPECRRIRRESAKLEHRCQLGSAVRQEGCGA